VNAIAPEVPPPGPEFVAATAALPGKPTNAAGIRTVTREALTKVVGNTVPFQDKLVAGMNPPPSIVKVNEPPPAAAVEGTRSVIDGIGLRAVKSFPVTFAPFTVTAAFAGVKV
jgi:hypothetical protein